jgi:dipeptidyl-peptidase-4
MAASAELPVNKRTVTLEDAIQRPAPGLSAPVSIQFSPDDKLVTYLYAAGGGLTQNLYAYDIESGQTRLMAAPPDANMKEGRLSPEEELLRERMRQVSLGITQYIWDKKQGRILIPYQGSLYILDKPGGSLRLLFDAAGKPALDPQFSPDGEQVAFVQDAEVYVLPVTGGQPLQITHGARGAGRSHGLAEYIAQEEMGRLRGYWWSEDSRRIAFTEVDETHIPVYRIVHQGKDATGESAQEDHRYPFAGAQNALVRLAVVSAKGGEPRWMDYNREKYEYLARVQWLPYGALCAQLENRLQDTLEIVRFDPQIGACSTLLKETSAVWINLHNMFTPLRKIVGKEQPGFLWASERSGYRHFYQYDKNGALIRQVTNGEWMVDELCGVDEEKGVVYFTATKADAREKHLYCVSLKEGEPLQISTEKGAHQIVLDNAKTRYVDTFASLTQPVTVSLCDLKDGALLKNLFTNQDARLNELELPPPEFVTIRNREGVALHGAIYHPPASFGEGPFPTIISVYGGPHAQRVNDHWMTTAAMQDQYLAGQGFLVFRLDNQGSARRGLAFEGVIKHRFGIVEVQDQVDGVNYLVQRGLTDPERVGVYGWSYGGYMSLMCLFQAPEVFKTAVAGAPVTHYDGYDTHYTERYMSTPQLNPEGYELGSAQHYVHQLQGHLLIIHGLIDENVHFRHTARLINALIAAEKPYELLLLPDSRHLTRKPQDIRYMMRRTAEHFRKTLCAG